MAVAVTTEQVYSPYVSPPETAGQAQLPSEDPGLFTGVAVFDGDLWAALCWELDIASVGSTAAEALGNLEQAVREAVRYAHENDRPEGRRVPDEAMREFMLSHKGSIPGTITRTFKI
jgi:predicted RNase H-like HicB family nuclease